MSEYIDRQALLDAIPPTKEDKQISLCGAIADFISLVCDVPAADVAPVVRCKECEHWGARKADGYGFCCIWGTSVEGNAFCSSGVKEDAK